MPAPLLDLVAEALDIDGCDAVEVGLSRSDVALTRFADSRVHQNVARVDGEARVRVVVDGFRVGVAVTNQLDPATIRRTAEQARAIARLSPPDPQYAGMPGAGLSYPTAGTDDDETADWPPEARAAAVATMLAGLPDGVVGAGFVQSGRVEQGIANSLGLRCAHAGTQAAASILASGADSTGYAEGSASSVTGVDFAALGERARGKVQLGRRPRDVAPGDWMVVLEPAATEVLVQFLDFMSFGGKDYNDGRSALSGRLGEKVCSERVTIVDDALSPLLPGVPFDAEGTPKRRVPLIEHGVAVSVGHDRASAARAGTASTGHALPPPNPYGPFPAHIIMQGGGASLDDLVAGCERGLYVTRFHYTNVVHPVQTVVTGMTRDGTFLIEDGRLAGGVHNLRFTQSILAALSDVEDVGADVEAASDAFFGAAAAPAVRLSRFAFTSGTAH
ncbi:MAG: TldD/PmbA family protein [Actinomycetota bacterium]|nr:TldD/PmbA family protein [Actinomycetota bacterium]